MNNLKVDSVKYNQIFMYDDDHLLKYSDLSTHVWRKIQTKEINFINKPSDIFDLSSYELEIYPISKSKVLLPILHGYSTLWNENFTLELETEDILKLFKKNLEYLKLLHQSGIYHGDIFPKNIMINSSLDLQFIDFDMSVVDDYVSPTNLYVNKEYDVKKSTMALDKMRLLRIYLHYLFKGDFKTAKYGYEYLDTLNISLPEKIEYQLASYLYSFLMLSEDYYFEDILSELFRLGYESPRLVARKLIRNHVGKY